MMPKHENSDGPWSIPGFREQLHQGYLKDVHERQQSQQPPEESFEHLEPLRPSQGEITPQSTRVEVEAEPLQNRHSFKLIHGESQPVAPEEQIDEETVTQLGNEVKARVFNIGSQYDVYGQDDFDAYALMQGLLTVSALANKPHDPEVLARSVVANLEKMLGSDQRRRQSMRLLMSLEALRDAYQGMHRTTEEEDAVRFESYRRQHPSRVFSDEHLAGALEDFREGVKASYALLHQLAPHAQSDDDLIDILHKMGDVFRSEGAEIKTLTDEQNMTVLAKEDWTGFSAPAS